MNMNTDHKNIRTSENLLKNILNYFLKKSLKSNLVKIIFKKQK